jgi:predicted dehydrogenase
MAETSYEINASESGPRIAAASLRYRPSDPRSIRPRIGLIGCGGITLSHLTAYRAANYDVVALCDVSVERAEARRCDFYPKAVVYSNYGELLARPDIDVADIATHPAERAQLIEDALRAGKHVLSQKPFVEDLDLGERLADLADSLGLKLAVNQNGRWAPHFSYVRQAIQSGLVGEVLGVHMGVHWNHDWIAGTPFDEVPHVVLYDFAIHWFDMLSCFMGLKVAHRVFASLAFADGQRAKPPLLGQALVEYEGAQATLVFDAFTRFGAMDTTVVTGTNGTIVSTGPDLGRQSVTLTTAEGIASPILEGSWFPDGFHGSMGELLCAIEEDREPSHSARSNLKSLAVCFAALRSAELGQPQTPGEVCRLNLRP